MSSFLSVDAGPATAFTPSITFGGAAVGLTYGTQSGQYQRIGNTIFGEALITLTAKGSSTGQAAVVGLPVVTNGGAFSYGALAQVLIENGASLAGKVVGQTAPGSAGFNLSTQGAADAAAVTNAEFTDTTEVRITFMYFV